MKVSVLTRSYWNYHDFTSQISVLDHLSDLKWRIDANNSRFKIASIGKNLISLLRNAFLTQESKLPPQGFFLWISTGDVPLCTATTGHCYLNKPWLAFAFCSTYKAQGFLRDVIWMAVDGQYLKICQRVKMRPQGLVATLMIQWLWGSKRGMGYPLSSQKY